MKMKTRTRAGFTFAEMLVVIIIILIGASLLLSAGQKAKGSADLAVCTSNLKQLISAMKLYQSEYDEYPPNSVLFPPFRQFYPQLLECRVSKNALRPNLRSEDYTMLGSAVGKYSHPKEVQEAFMACRLIRGGAIPIALDVNHANGILSKENRQAIFLVARDDGSVQRVKAGNVVDRTEPCSTDWLSDMFNY